MKEADKEKTLKEVAEATTKEKGTTARNAKERARVAERVYVLVKQKVAEIAAKLEKIELHLASTESLNSIKDKEIAKLKTALEANEDKRYNTSFADAENSAEPVMFQSRRWRHWWPRVCPKILPLNTLIKFLTLSLLL